MENIFDFFNQQEKPSLTLCNPNRAELYSLDLATDFVYVPRFNALSEISFRFPRSIDNNQTINLAYDFIKNKRLIKMELNGTIIGYFQITEPEEELNGEVPVKIVTATSQECELIAKRLTVFQGTYQFYNATNPSASLLGHIFSMAPTWSVGTIDSELALKFRTFDVTDTTIYKFLMDDVSVSYGCVFSFDTANKKISASLTDNATTTSDIYMSFDNLIKKGSFKEINEEIITVLGCYGGGDLDIRTVNPLGSVDIYNFDYFKTVDWMSLGLINAITAWEAKIAYYQPLYATSLTELKDENDLLIVKEGELVTLQDEYLALEGVQKVRIEQGLDYKEITYQMEEKQKQITAKIAEIAVVETTIESIQTYLKTIKYILKFTTTYTQQNREDTAYQKSLVEAQIVNEEQIIDYYTHLLSEKEPILAQQIEDRNIDRALLEQIKEMRDQIVASEKSLVSLQEELVNLEADLEEMDLDLLYPANFTNEQYQELTIFFYEGTYQNENIIQTDSMTNAQIQEQAQELYDQCRGIFNTTTGKYEGGVIEKLSYPRYEFSVDAINFTALVEYQDFTNQLSPGTIITVDLGDGREIETVVLEININYDKVDDFDITFSNRLRLDNGKFRFTDLLGQVRKTSSTTSFKAKDWDDWKDNYKNDVTEFINSALNTARNQIINSTNQEITINQNGLRGRTVIDPKADTIAYEDTQVWMTSGLIAFTDDNWQTAKLALGKITAPDGSTSFGLAAETLIGRLVASNQLIIQSGDGTSFLVNSQGAFLNNATLQVTKGSNRIYIDPVNGIKITKNNVNQFFVDSNGNIQFTGNLSGATGTFSGTITATSGTIGGIGLGTIPGSSYTGIYIVNKASDFYIRSNGDMKWGNLTVTGGNFTFSGTIRADQIIGQITNTQIATGLDAGKVTSGSMSGNRVFGGQIGGAGGSYVKLSENGVLHLGAGSVQLNGSISLNGTTYLGGSINGTTGSGITINGANVRVNSGGIIASFATIGDSGMNSSGQITVDNNIRCYGTLYLNSASSFACSGTVSQTVFVGPLYTNKQLNFKNGLLMSYDIL